MTQGTVIFFLNRKASRGKACLEKEKNEQIVGEKDS